MILYNKMQKKSQERDIQKFKYKYTMNANP